MSDIVLTLPLSFRWGGLKGLAAWIAEGDAAGDHETGAQYCFSIGGFRPSIEPGERVYIWYSRRLIGYAPLVRLFSPGDYRWEFWRRGGAVAVTIDERRVGWRGWRRRWWDRCIEYPFPEWRKI